MANEDVGKEIAAEMKKVEEEVKHAAEEAVATATEAATEAKEAITAATPPSSIKEWLPSKDSVKRGLCDFKNVFLFPLCTGLMTGIGFVAGKRLAESYFYGSNPKVAVQ